MLVLNILSGAQSGQSFPLKEGVTVIGRDPSADIVIDSSQVSKQHAHINVVDNIVYLKDLGSRNGTFVNGVQIKQQAITPKDKITLHNVVIMIANEKVTPIDQSSPQPALSSFGNAAIDHNPYNFDSPAPAAEANAGQKMEAPFDLKSKVDAYLDEVVLPGVYKLTEWFDFKWVLAGFLGALIFLITVLSTLPALSLLKSSIEKESQRRALTIAKNLAEINKSNLAQGLFSSVNLSSSSNEPGVIQAIIVAPNGSVIAPSSRAGEHLDIPFLHTARQEGKLQVKQISSNEIGAIVPIRFYNSNTGSQSVSAYSFILYDMGSLAIDDGRTISLYIQILFISLIVGGLMMYFIFKIFEYPFAKINSQLNEELKNPVGNIKLNYNFEIVQQLISNVNSSLSRTQNDSLDLAGLSHYDRTAEINNIVQMVGFPALAVLNSNQSIAAVNSSAEEVLSLGPESITTPIEQLNDQALKLSIKDLIAQATLSPSQIVNNDLEISGANYELMILSIYGKDEISYFVISFIPKEELD